jgi:hypothetical protein
MVAPLLVVAVMAGAPDQGASADRSAYEAARVQVGRDADAHTRLALWCEAHGLKPERSKHLAMAVLIDPRNAMARGLLGLVDYQGKWLRPEAVAESVTRDQAAAAKWKEYVAKRMTARDTADAQWKLGLWCDENGLAEQARAHFARVVRLDPKRDAAWKRLGFRREGNRWVTRDQLGAEKSERELQTQANREWKPRLEKWRKWMTEKAKYDDGRAALKTVSDPRAVPSVWSVFALGDADHQLVAVDVLSQIDAADASRAIALLAAFGETREVRRTALDALAKRDRREFAYVLISMIQDPIKYEVRHVQGPGSPGELFIAGKKSNLKRVYLAPPPQDQVRPGDAVEYDQNGDLQAERYLGSSRYSDATLVGPLAYFYGQPSPAGLANVSSMFARSGLGPQISQLLAASAAQAASTIPSPFIPIAPNVGVLIPVELRRVTVTADNIAVIPVSQMAAEAEKAALSSEDRLEADVRDLEQYNTSVRKASARVLVPLRAVVGKDLGEERQPWESWWLDEIGFAAKPTSQEAPTQVEEVGPSYDPEPIEPVVFQQVTGVALSSSCFAAGTPVRTLAGSQPIEKLHIGDLVLTQNISTGALGYRAILGVLDNGPSRTFEVKVGGETILSSPFHRFWASGRGWVMARDLKPGQMLRTLAGVAPVESIREGAVRRVYNLDVAEDADFFVGTAGALVHDNSLPDLRLKPFDAPPTAPVTASPRSGKP